ncbi:aldehyde dehydrogenase family protein [Roseibium denhamense]|uniref:Aldehyde dehydrogenase (NAD+)/betaine-aldehyde dehydrogenase n=1 Tax=Roseibium denhamense TaxID=76305 RepID=A0ABY1P3Y5_9HYPH|nr:aldehyde dehydrogenase family protein [Roseibium denhamense]MTI05160.1 aldehyde dehydrogenase family protein [Roseibium denhamense]SMP25895.1 aldehyde dehydrogenase (NAD+)/betaine-aldehyde dehydrogenase [Roseibium denhamense]
MSVQDLAQDYLATGKLGTLPDGHFINGKLTAASNGKMESFDPGRAEAFAEFSLASAEEMDAAIGAAEKAAAHWRRVAPGERCRILNEVARVFRANADRLAVMEVIDSGKTLAEATGDVNSSARLFEYYAGAADKLDGRSVNLGPDYTAFTVREPVGVTGHIIPWNYPTSTFARGVAPALAAGCSVVAKPAETTPFTALLMAELLSEAGVPDGLVNVVTGLGRDVGAQLARDPRIKQLTFTGSVATGVNVAQMAAPNITRLTLELGGKSPLIAFEDADPEKVADGAYWAIFSNSGQICSAGSRLILHKSIRGDVLDILAERASKIKPGHGLRSPDMGAINSDLHLSRIKAHVDAAKSRGVSILTGGDVTTDCETGKGWFFQPTVIADLQPNDPAVQEEIFGPVLSVQNFETEDEAIALANGTEFGLIASVYTRDVGRSMRVAAAMDCGQVSINDYWAGGLELPFGGNKKSGYGREKGWEGLDAYTKVKSITVSNAS